MLKMLQMAGEIALPTIQNDPRNFLLGCVGVRKDGVIVSAKNGAVYSTQVENYQLIPEAHAEGRVLRKLDRGGTLYVARIARSTGGYAMAAPCAMCSTRIRSFKVEEVFYTINDYQYGVWYVKKDVHKVFVCRRD